MTRLLILFLILVAEFCGAQIVNRIDHFTGYADETSWNAVPDNLGGYYAVISFGDSIAPDPQNQQFFINTPANAGTVLIHVDNSGQLLWFFPLTLGSAGITEVVADQTGAVYILGIHTGSMYLDSTYGFQFTAPVSNRRDIFLAKFNYSGAFAWVDMITDVSGQLHYNEPRSITLHGNDVLIAGRFHQVVDFDPGPAQYPLTGPSNVNDYSIFLATYSQSNGAWIRTTEFTSSGGDYSLTGIECTPGGKIFIAGVLDDFVDFGGTILNGGGDDDLYIACYSYNHTLQWAFSCGDVSANQEVADLAVTTDRVIICGHTAGYVDFDPGLDTALFNFSSGFVVNYDTLGNLVWANELRQTTSLGFAAPLTLEVWGNAILAGGSFTGTTDLDPSAGTFLVSGGNTFIRGFVAIYDLANGSFRKGWSSTGNGTFASQVRDICHTTSSTMLLDFTFDGVLDVDPTTSSNMVTCTPSSSGSMPDVCIVTYDFLDIGISETSTAEISFSAFPCPASDQLHVTYTEEFTAASVYNANGQLILSETFSKRTFHTIETKNMIDGVYILEISSGQFVLREKFSVITK